MGTEGISLIISSAVLGITALLLYFFTSVSLLLLFFSLLWFLLCLRLPEKRRRAQAKKQEHKPAEKEKKKETLLGNVMTRIYHLETCPAAKKIPTKKRVQFDSRLAAVEEGFAAHACMGV